MKTKLHRLIIGLALFASLHQAVAQGTAFTYQGRLNDGTNPANGQYDFQFQVFDAATAGTSYGSPNPNTITGVGVTNGLFGVTLDFGSQIFSAGASRWLQTSVRTNGAVTYTNLSPRQPLLPTPYAIYAELAGIASSVSNAAISASALNTAGSPSSGQVLSYTASGMSWLTPGWTNSLALPYSASASSSSPLFTLQNTGTGSAGAFLGKVGIGTTAPAYPLDVQSGQAVSRFTTTNSLNGSVIELKNSVTTSAYSEYLGAINFNDGSGNGIPGQIGYQVFPTGLYVGAPDSMTFTVQHVQSVEMSSTGLTAQNSSNNAVAISGVNSLSGVSGELGVTSYSLQGDFYNQLSCGVYGNGNVSSTLGNASGNYAGYFDGSVAVKGNTSLSGFVGIGTIYPVAQLDEEGSDDSGNFLTPVALIRNNDTGNAAAPALTVAGMGNTGNGVLCVTTGGTGLLARFGNASTWVADIRNNGTIDAVAFNTTSDRNAKENFSAISPRAVLEKVASLPITKWNFKKDGGTSHIGPMAQDFHAAFNVGTDDKHIATVDEDGVALAAIQGLNQKVDAKDSEIQTLKEQNDSLQRRLETLEEAVQSLAEKK